MRTGEEKQRHYQVLSDLMMANKEYKNNPWKCIKAFYKQEYKITLDDAIECHSIPSIATIERDWRKIRENNPKLKDEELSKEEFLQTALDTVIIDNAGKARII